MKAWVYPIHAVSLSSLIELFSLTAWVGHRATRDPLL